MVVIAVLLLAALLLGIPAYFIFRQPYREIVKITRFSIENDQLRDRRQVIKHFGFAVIGLIVAYGIFLLTGTKALSSITLLRIFAGLSVFAGIIGVFWMGSRVLSLFKAGRIIKITVFPAIATSSLFAVVIVVVDFMSATQDDKSVSDTFIGKALTASAVSGIRYLDNKFKADFDNVANDYLATIRNDEKAQNQIAQLREQAFLLVSGNEEILEGNDDFFREHPGFIKALMSENLVSKEYSERINGEYTLAKPAIWKTSDHDTTVHILGTVHALPDYILWRHGLLRSVLDSADFIYLEADINAVLNPDDELQKSIAERILAENGERTKDLLSVDAKNWFLEWGAEFGLDQETTIGLLDLEPWAVAFSVMPVVEAMSEGLDFRNGMERTITEDIEAAASPSSSTEAGFTYDPIETKTTSASASPLEATEYVSSPNLRYLETIDDIFGIFETLPRNRVVEELHDFLCWDYGDCDPDKASTSDGEAEDSGTFEDTTSKEDKFFTELVSVWSRGDINALSSLLHSEGEYDEFGLLLMDELLYQRNANWAQQVQTMLEQETGAIVISVGAFHMIGETSLIELLESRGLEVARIQ